MYLIFGSTGSIGNSICNYFEQKELKIARVSSSREDENYILVNKDNLSNLLKIETPISGIVFCQGYNFNDKLSTFNDENYKKIMDGNVEYILNILHFLLKNEKLFNCKICIISSIWQEFTRIGKLSYTISKSALSGLTQSLAGELAEKNVLINNVLPGVIENEMSLSTLSSSQLENVRNATGFKRLISLADVSSIVYYLVVENTGITGQSIKVDLGFTMLKSY